MGGALEKRNAEVEGLGDLLEIPRPSLLNHKMDESDFD
jgi:hypothetical protein